MKTYLSFLFLFLAPMLFAQTGQMNLVDSEKVYRLDTVTQLFVDSTSELTFSEVSQLGFQEYFRPLDSTHLAGETAWACWLKISVKNESKTSTWKWVLTNPQHLRSKFLYKYLPYQDFVDVHVIKKDGILTSYRSGKLVPASEKSCLADVPTMNAALLELEKGQEVTLYIRIKKPPDPKFLFLLGALARRARNTTQTEQRKSSSTSNLS